MDIFTVKEMMLSVEYAYRSTASLVEEGQDGDDGGDGGDGDDDGGGRGAGCLHMTVKSPVTVLVYWWWQCPRW